MRASSSARAGDDRLAALLKPCPTEDMQAHPVSRVVNNPKNDTAECVALLSDGSH